MNNYPPNPDNHLYYGEWMNEGLGGWYTPGGCDFAAYLHNPWGFPSEIGKKAIQRFTDIIPNIDDYIYTTIMRFFGNKEENQNKGLTEQYQIFMKYIIDNKLIGIIIWGANINNINRDIVNYVTIDNKEITLGVNSICQYLIKEYIKEDNVNELCRVSLE